MTKCNFCVSSTPNGECRERLTGSREYECQMAIKRMAEALKTDSRKEFTKCDFCVSSTPNGECRERLSGSREYECQMAIKRMLKSGLKLK